MIVASVDFVGAVLEGQTILIAQDHLGCLASGSARAVIAVFHKDVGPYATGISEKPVVNEVGAEAECETKFRTTHDDSAGRQIGLNG